MFKTLVICFSMSGYTRKVAERIREGVTEVTGHCELVNLRDVDSGDLANYDLVGLGCPVYYYKEPFNVSDFIEDLPELNGKHWFVFCTHGSVMGKTLVSMSERLAKKGVKVVGYHHTYADATAPFFPYPVPTTGHPDEAEYEAAREFGRQIAKQGSRGEFGEPAPGPVPDEWVQAADVLTAEVISQVMPRLSIDMEKCVLCHECEENCPANGIDVEAEPPRIQNPCIYCLQCAMICPEVAIEADWDTEDAAGAGEALFNRYIEELKKAEARGEFRWYVDPKSIDLRDTQFSKRKRKLKK